MDLVRNTNYKGAMKQSVNLELLHLQIANSKLHRKPYQLVVKDCSGTVIFFSTGNFRIMGCVDELDATFLAYKYTKYINQYSYPTITSQTHTSTAKLGYSVDIKKFASQMDSIIYEPELFPALRICKFKPASVNLFSTGSVVVCGLREPAQMHDILHALHSMCEQYRL